MTILPISDPAFASYGKILEGYDTQELLRTLEAATPLPQGVEYVPSQPELEALPLAPSGTYLVASRPAVMGKQGTRNVVLQPESWYAVQDCTVYPLEDADLVRLLDNADVTLEVFNAAPLYAKAMAAGGWGSSIRWDGKLAAYLLDASASKYQVGELVPSYKAAAAFTYADYPDAGRLADLFAKMKAEITACGEDALYNDIEFPLAQVLADMTRIGVLVDRDGIEQFGVRMRTELEQVLARIHMENPEFHGGRYQELLLTNRQYAFARHAQGSICITAANSDDQESRLSIPVPLHASQAENLMDGSIIPVENGTLNLTLPGNSSVVLKIRED